MRNRDESYEIGGKKAQDIFKDVLSNQLYDYERRLIVDIRRYTDLAKKYPLGAIEYYKKELFVLLEQAPQGMLWSMWEGSNFGCIFGELDPNNSIFVPLDITREFLAKKDKLTHEEMDIFLEEEFIDFFPIYIRYHALNELLEEEELQTNWHQFLRPNKNVVEEFRKIESQLIQNGYVENGVWIGKSVELQELCALLLLHNYFRQDIQHKESNGSVDGVKIREFCRIKFGVDLEQHFQSKRLEEIIDRVKHNNRRLKNINIKPQ